MEKIIIVPPEAQSERLDRFLSTHLDFISRTKICKLIEKENLLVDYAVKKPSFRLKGNERITIKIEEEKSGLEPYELEVKVIYEDEDILVVDKPLDLVVHPPQKGYDKTLVNALIYMKKELSLINPLRPGVVHRLDKETSGVMVLAKNNRTHLNLVESFRKREVKKEYRAIVWGEVAKEHLTIDMPLTRDSRNRLKMKVSFLNSKNAYTEIDVLERFSDSTYLSLKIHTGRMHQIRVHLKFLGYPIVGDKKYGIKDSYNEMFLHAYKLGFKHPSKEEFMEWTSPLPQRFNQFMEEREK